MLTILPDPRTEEITPEESTWFVPRPRPSFDEWTYKEIVQKQLVDILDATGLGRLKAPSATADLSERRRQALEELIAEVERLHTRLAELVRSTEADAERKQ